MTLAGLEPGTVYFWRPVSSASPEKIGAELSFTVDEDANVKVLGFTTDDAAGASPAQPADKPTVLGFELLPKTGGNEATLVNYYVNVVAIFTTILSVLYLGYRKVRPKA